MWSIADENGSPVNSRIELSTGEIVLHSRGGAFGQANLRNPEYSKALTLILERIRKSHLTVSAIWLDSTVARKWPEEKRLLAGATDLALPVAQLASLVRSRAASKGRPSGAAGQGNTTKRLRISVPEGDVAALEGVLQASRLEPTERLPNATLRKVTEEMIDAAVDALIDGAVHNFDPSRDYDVLAPTGQRLPPKAVFGIALEKVIGESDGPPRATWPHCDFCPPWSERSANAALAEIQPDPRCDFGGTPKPKPHTVLPATIVIVTKFRSR